MTDDDKYRAPAARAGAGGTACKQHAKPLLTVEQQISHMKSRGISFELCSEEEAAEHLRVKCQFFRIYSYRALFERCAGGPRDGQYVNLDFGHLKALSNLDRVLRDTLLPMTLDVEHFAKMRLLAAAEDHGEDGYAVIRDYLSSVSGGERSRILGEMRRRENDPYSGAVVRKYEGDMPIWVFCEIVPLGVFTDLVKFCADRWGDAGLEDIHYQLKSTRQIRNAGAHGACVLNDVAGEHRAIRPPAALVNAMIACGIPKRLRKRWLGSRRMVQICSLLYLFAQIAPSGSVRTDRIEALSSLFGKLDECALPRENPGMAALFFLKRLTSCFGLLN